MYTIIGWQTGNTDAGCDAERTADTLREAKAEARYMLTEAYRRACESETRIAIVRIMRGDTIVGDFI